MGSKEEGLGAGQVGANCSLNTHAKIINGSSMPCGVCTGLKISQKTHAQQQGINLDVSQKQSHAVRHHFPNATNSHTLQARLRVAYTSFFGPPPRRQIGERPSPLQSQPLIDALPRQAQARSRPRCLPHRACAHANSALFLSGSDEADLAESNSNSRVKMTRAQTPKVFQHESTRSHYISNKKTQVTYVAKVEFCKCGLMRRASSARCEGWSL